MKIKQIGRHNGDIIETVLNNRNIHDLELFLTPTNEDDIDPLDFVNMERAAMQTLAHISIRSKIGILVDPDADGYSSSSIIYQYIKRLDPQADLIYFMHNGKSHGLASDIMKQISNSSIELLIIPDAGSNNVDELNLLTHMGIDVIVIDHHEVDVEPPHEAIVVNNQFKENRNTNKNLVGAGMILKFCEAMDKNLHVKYADLFYDLAAVGQVGDSSDISQNEVRKIVQTGIENLRNPFIIHALMQHFVTTDNIAPRDLSFSIIPLINAVTRVGTFEEKVLLFRALNSIDAEETFEVVKRKKNKITGKFDKFDVTQNLYEYAYDVCSKVKGRQASLIKKTMEQINIDTSTMLAIGIIDNNEVRSISGLIANKVLGKYQKPALCLHLIEEEASDGTLKRKYAGSGRGSEKIIASFKDWCNDTGLVEFARGHANAFGISIYEEDFEAFKEKAKEITFQETVYEVDLLSRKKVDKKLILEIVENKHLFGGKVHEPLLAFAEINVNKRFIRARGSVLTFFDSGVEFIMFSAPPHLYDELQNNFDQYIPMTFVGRASVNEYGGKITPQLVLSDCARFKPEQVEEQAEKPIVNKISAADLVF